MYKNIMKRMTERFVKKLIHVNRCQIRKYNINAAQRWKDNIISQQTFGKTVISYFDTRLLQNIKDSQEWQLKEDTIFHDIDLLTTRLNLLKYLGKGYEEELRDIDAKSCSMLYKMTYDEILFLLNTLSTGLKYDIISIAFYARSISLLKNAILNSKLSDRQLINFLYFTGLAKESEENYVQMVLQHISDFSKLSVIEQCVVAEVSFKLSIKIPKQYIMSYENLLETETNYLLQNPQFLVVLCKAIRFNGASEHLSLSNLSKQIHNLKSESIATYTHILQLYAEIHVCNKNAINFLVTKVIDSIHYLNQSNEPSAEDYKQKNIGHILKYVDNLLWSLSELYCNLLEHQMSLILSWLNNTLVHLEKDPTKMLHILLHLWMLDHKRAQVLAPWLTRGILENVLNEPAWKPKARLQLLVSCISIEAPNLYIPETLKEEVNVRLQITDSIVKIHTIVRKLLRSFKTYEVQINCPVPGVYIAGVSITNSNGMRIHMDILNAQNCLRFTKEPHGLMRLKLRLLKKLGWQSILINGDCIYNDRNATNDIKRSLHMLGLIK